MTDKARWFLTVEWCKDGKRGVFCSADGDAFQKGEPHTELEMQEILGPFWVILSSKSIEMTLEKLKEYTYFRPLAEYKLRFGIAFGEEDVPQGAVSALAVEV